MSLFFVWLLKDMNFDFINPKTMTRRVVLNIAGCFSADHLHENGAVIGIQDGAEDDSRKH